MYADGYNYGYNSGYNGYFQPRGLSGLGSNSPGPWSNNANPQNAYTNGAYLNAQLAGFADSGTCADSPSPMPCAQSPAPMSCDVPMIDYQVSVPRHTFQKHTQPITWVTETVDLMPVQAMQAMAPDAMHTPICNGTVKAPSARQNANWAPRATYNQRSNWLIPNYTNNY